jgi:hypothetical protein
MYIFVSRFLIQNYLTDFHKILCKYLTIARISYVVESECVDYIVLDDLSKHHPKHYINCEAFVRLKSVDLVQIILSIRAIIN